MKTLQQRLEDLTAAVIARLKPVVANQGNLAALSTTAKDNLVNAINELKAQIATGGESSVINDAATGGAQVVYSVDKVLALINGLKDEILGEGASEALNSFVELQAALANDETVANQLVAAMAKRVSVSSAQSFTDEEKAQGQANLGVYGMSAIGDPDTDFAAIFNAAMDA